MAVVGQQNANNGQENEQPGDQGRESTCPG
jgi:hypothetical protein